MVFIGIMVHLSARERVNRGRGQWDIGPVGPIGFSGFRSSLGLLLLSSLSTYKMIYWRDTVTKNLIKKKINYKLIHKWDNTENCCGCFWHVTNVYSKEIQFSPDMLLRLQIHLVSVLTYSWTHFHTGFEWADACQCLLRNTQGCLMKSLLPLIDWLKSLKSP